MGFAGEFVIVGHRGAAGLAPENTLAGFRLATDLGVDAVELDVRLVDGRLAVFHDEGLKRIMGIDQRLDSLSWPALRALDAGKGERVPELAEVLTLLPDEVGANIELKGPGTGLACAQYLNRCQPSQSILVSSFFDEELEEFRAAFPAHENRVRLGLLLHKRRADAFAVALRLGAWSIHIGDGLAEPRYIESILDNGFQVFVYTVNNRARIEELRGAKVRGIFTDFPDLPRQTQSTS